MNLEEKYKDIIEVYKKTGRKNEEFEYGASISRKHKFKSNFEYDDFGKEERKHNKRDKSKRKLEI